MAAGVGDFAVPIHDRYLEDYVPGSVYEFGEITVSQHEIIDFAERFDPQSFHVDPAEAAHGPFAASSPAAGTPRAS